MSRRVVITGMGVIAPLGQTVPEFFRAQIQGQSCVGPITHFDASTLPTTFAAEVRGFELSRYVSEPERWNQAGMGNQFSAAAAHLALVDAGLRTDARVDRTRFGVYLGTGDADA